MCEPAIKSDFKAQGLKIGAINEEFDSFVRVDMHIQSSAYGRGLRQALRCRTSTSI